VDEDLNFTTFLQSKAGLRKSTDKVLAVNTKSLHRVKMEKENFNFFYISGEDGRRNVHFFYISFTYVDHHRKREKEKSQDFDWPSFFHSNN